MPAVRRLGAADVVGLLASDRGRRRKDAPAAQRASPRAHQTRAEGV